MKSMHNDNDNEPCTDMHNNKKKYLFRTLLLYS